MGHTYKNLWVHPQPHSMLENVQMIRPCIQVKNQRAKHIHRTCNSNQCKQRQRALSKRIKLTLTFPMCIHLTLLSIDSYYLMACWLCRNWPRLLSLYRYGRQVDIYIEGEDEKHKVMPAVCVAADEWTSTAL